MNRQQLISALAETPEDEILLARLWDRFSAGTRKNIPTASCFLTGREQLLARQLVLQGNLGEPAFFGGVPGAERQVLVYVPDYLTPEDYLRGPDGPVAALRIRWSRYDTLSHRDFLGSLMGQGIKREVLGDILPGENLCDVLVLREMTAFLLDQLTRVGRAAVEVREISLSEVQVPQQKVKIIRDTVAAMRLDSVLSAGFGQGRSQAVICIQSGRTELNHRTVLKPDCKVAEGDILSVRGLGKLRVKSVNGRTKKGRIALTLERYL